MNTDKKILRIESVLKIFLKGGITSISLAAITSIVAIFYIAIEKPTSIYSVRIILLSYVSIFSILFVFVLMYKTKVPDEKSSTEKDD